MKKGANLFLNKRKKKTLENNKFFDAIGKFLEEEMIAGRSPIFTSFNYMDSDFERTLRDSGFNSKLFKDIQLKSYVVDLASSKFNASRLVKNIPKACGAPRNNFIVKLIHSTLITQFDTVLSEAVEIRALYSDSPLLMLAKKDPAIGLTLTCAKTLTYNGVTLS